MTQGARHRNRGSGARAAQLRAVAATQSDFVGRPPGGRGRRKRRRRTPPELQRGRKGKIGSTGALAESLAAPEPQPPSHVFAAGPRGTQGHSPQRFPPRRLGAPSYPPSHLQRPHQRQPGQVARIRAAESPPPLRQRHDEHLPLANHAAPTSTPVASLRSSDSLGHRHLPPLLPVRYVRCPPPQARLSPISVPSCPFQAAPTLHSSPSPDNTPSPPYIPAPNPAPFRSPNPLRARRIPVDGCRRLPHRPPPAPLLWAAPTAAGAGWGGGVWHMEDHLGQASFPAPQICLILFLTQPLALHPSTPDPL